MYEQVASEARGSLYRWKPDGGSAPGPVWAGYLLAEPDGPPTLDLRPSWEEHWGAPARGVNGGSYVFAAETPDPGFLGRALDYLGTLNAQFGGFAYRFFFWFAAPNPAAGQPL